MKVCNSSKAVENSISLSNEEFQNYYDALCEDNLEKVKETLTHGDNKTTLLHGYFDFGAKAKSTRLAYLKSILLKPLHIAVVNASKNVAEYLLEQGADPTQRDIHGYTLVHSLVAEAAISRQSELRCIEMYDWLIAHLDKETSTQLLHGENDLKLRPIEYAAKVGALRLLQHILYTDDIYVAKSATNGSILYRWHDVTDYENGSRISRSPLVFLPHLDQSRIEDDADLFQLLESQLFKKWTKKKYYSNCMPIFVWFVLRLVIYIIGFISYTDATAFKMLIEARGLNASEMICPSLDRSLDYNVALGLNYALIITSLGVILFDICDIAVMKFTPWYCAMHGKRDQEITNQTFFRKCQFGNSFCIASFYLYDLTNEIANFSSSENGSYAFFPAYLLPLLFSWSLMYFMQVLPSVGVAVNSIQQMVRDTMHFAIFYLLFLIPFYIIFQNIMTIFSKQGCIDDFKDDISTLFTLNLMMFHIVDPREYDVSFQDGLRFLFMMYTFMCAVILLNFLLARMAGTASKTENANTIILTLNRLAVSCVVEKRIYWLFRRYYMKAKSWMFDTDSSGKVYIVTSENRYATLKNSPK